MESQIKYYEMYKKILTGSFDPVLCKKEFSERQKSEHQNFSKKEIEYFKKMALLNSKIEEIKRSISKLNTNQI